MTSFNLYAATTQGLRDNNEDSFIVCTDIENSHWSVPENCNQTISLGTFGCLMVVADGMGGQNAGEVASAIAVQTVQEMFSPNKIPSNVVESSDKAKAWLRKVIVQADCRVKAYGKEHDEAQGLGSTLVVAWLVCNSLLVGWIGDSRAYSVIVDKGIARLSKDHSYVQQLVDIGKLAEEDAINHPNSNIITRSLGDTSQKAHPDIEAYSVEDGEVIMLCSDGLCGTCTDNEIGVVIQEECSDLKTCVNKLISEALKNGSSDNITIAIMRVHTDSTDNAIPPSNPAHKRISWHHSISHKWLSPVNIAFTLITAFLIGALGFAAYYILCPAKIDKEAQTDSISLSLSQDTLTYGDNVNITISGVDPSKVIIKYDSFLLKLDGPSLTLRKNLNTDKLTEICLIDKHTQNKVKTKNLYLKSSIENRPVRTVVNKEIEKLAGKIQNNEAEEIDVISEPTLDAEKKSGSTVTASEKSSVSKITQQQ